MNEYLFEGVVLPERAQLTSRFAIDFQHVSSSLNGRAEVSIMLNKVAVWIASDDPWDMFDLRNVVRSFVQNHLAVVGFLEGFAYDLELTRVLNRGLDIDLVFGIDIPCIAERNRNIDKASRFALIQEKSAGLEGIFIHRCLNDLTMAMKIPDDTGFYCYRAIESLRQHCIVKFELDPGKKTEQWTKLRNISRCDEATLMEIKLAADVVRHGGFSAVTSHDREMLFLKTWDVVDAYLENV